MATKKPKGLGRGLEALLGPKVQDGENAAPGESASSPGLPATLSLLEPLGAETLITVRLGDADADRTPGMHRVGRKARHDGRPAFDEPGGADRENQHADDVEQGPAPEGGEGGIGQQA